MNVYPSSYQTQHEVFPDMPQAPEITFPDQPDLFGTDNCKWKKIGYIVGEVLAVLLIIYGIYYAQGWPILSYMELFIVFIASIVSLAVGYWIGRWLTRITNGNGGGPH